jgi:hypothetical protein
MNCLVDKFDQGEIFHPFLPFFLPQLNFSLF